MALDVVVLVTGIADPKHPLPPLSVSANVVALNGAAPTILGSFDEAALEVALKLRDTDPATRVTVVLLDRYGCDALASTIGGHRPDRLLRVDASALPLWDAAAAAAFCAQVIHGVGEPSLVLIGREFGDLDDGALPPCIAERLGWRFAALVQEVGFLDGRLEFMREGRAVREWTALPAPVVASVTNDRRNRLRHPLLKNVMAAKRASYPTVKADTELGHPDLSLSTASPMPAPSRGSGCRLLEGPLDRQVVALSRYLLEAGRAP